MEGESRWIEYSGLLVGHAIAMSRLRDPSVTAASITAAVDEDVLHPVYRKVFKVVIDGLSRGRKLSPRSVVADCTVKGIKIDEEELTRYVVEGAQISLDELTLHLKKFRVYTLIVDLVARIANKGRVEQSDFDELNVLYEELYRLEAHVNPFISAADLLEDDSYSPYHVVRRPFPVPAGVVGFIASAGGVGKSYTSLLLAISAASSGRKVAYFSYEDPPWVVRERIRYLIELASRDEHSPFDEPGFDTGEVLSRLLVSYDDPEAIVDPRDLSFTSKGEFMRSALLRALDEGVSLVIVDPIASLIAEENSNAYAAKFVSLFNSAVRASGHELTVLLVHHVSKTVPTHSISEHNYFTAHSLRGASAFVNAAKYVVELARLSQMDQDYACRLCVQLAEALGIPPEAIAGAPVEQRREVIVVHNTKNNYFPIFAPRLITVNPGELTGALGISVFSSFTGGSCRERSERVDSSM